MYQVHQTTRPSACFSLATTHTNLCQQLANQPTSSCRQAYSALTHDVQPFMRQLQRFDGHFVAVGL